MEPLAIGLAAFAGGIVGSLLGWLDSQEAFNARKFILSVVHSLVAGIGYAYAYDYAAPLTLVSIFGAFLIGAGFDAGLNRLEGAVAARIKR
jgi:hypothetical protein